MFATHAIFFSADSSASQKSLSREQSVEVIHLDVLRTFPTLGFFQAVNTIVMLIGACIWFHYINTVQISCWLLWLQVGPYHQTLHDVLGAYACYRPDIGYVQGMSFLAAVLLLNMEAADAFISLANLLNRPSYLAFFRVDHTLMRPYFDSFNIFIHDFMPKLGAHFEQLQFSPEYYLIEWWVFLSVDCSCDEKLFVLYFWQDFHYLHSYSATGHCLSCVGHVLSWWWLLSV